MARAGLGSFQLGLSRAGHGQRCRRRDGGCFAGAEWGACVRECVCKCMWGCECALGVRRGCGVEPHLRVRGGVHGKALGVQNVRGHAEVRKWCGGEEGAGLRVPAGVRGA